MGAKRGLAGLPPTPLRHLTPPTDHTRQPATTTVGMGVQMKTRVGMGTRRHRDSDTHERGWRLGGRHPGRRLVQGGGFPGAPPWPSVWADWLQAWAAPLLAYRQGQRAAALEGQAAGTGLGRDRDRDRTLPLGLQVGSRQGMTPGAHSRVSSGAGACSQTKGRANGTCENLPGRQHGSGAV